VAAASPVASKIHGLAFLAASSAVVAYQYDRKSSYVHCSALPVQGVPGTNLERTFLAVKPDGVQRGLIGDIIARFEKRGYKVRLETLISGISW
jgi:nucleoside-diphosphate kinase